MNWGKQMLDGIREVKISKDVDGNYRRVRVVFGPHHYVELKRSPSGRVSFDLGATHHGFRADASEVNGDLEQIIDSVRCAYPDNVVD